MRYHHIAQSLKSQYKFFLKTLRNFNYSWFFGFHWFFKWVYLTNSLGERQSVCLLSDVFYLVYFVFQYFFSWVLFLHDCLGRTLQIVAKLDDHNTFKSFWVIFNAFELVTFIRHFCDMYISHIFVIHNITFSSLQPYRELFMQ